ncbi:MAG: substrate-binding domain-containing protein, partial [Pyrinomonadaceae bacterium]|nr:substrate-binding domain-containing protein [Pyrinomonadaceae bacterium]
SAHDPILYPVAIIKDSIKDSQRQAAAQSFVELLISPEGQAILNGQGFQSVDQSVSPK